MSNLLVRGIDSAFVNSIRAGGVDANAQVAVPSKAAGARNPCRHCLQLIAEGDDLLVLAYRPFATLQPYAELGPIFLHARNCEQYCERQLPAWFAQLQPAIIRGYYANDWICYSSGNVISGADLGAECEKILSNPEVAYVHIRSKFNCFQCRVERQV